MTVVQALGLVSGVIIAVGGWIITQFQGRRAVRRNMRIEYLLAAYRRIDGASNRKLNIDERRELEAAYSDVMLLGSPAQVQLAERFVEEFQSGVADARPLLENLRASLRRELLLEVVPPKRLWLRIGRDDEELSSPHGSVAPTQQELTD